MKYNRELKVGLAIIFAVIVFVLGVRFFEDIPIFRGTYTLHTDFQAADGLLSGNAVRINGVDIGAIESVKLDPTTHKVLVRFHIDSKLKVPVGSHTVVEGIAALGNVYINLVLAPDNKRYIEEGGHVPGRTTAGLSAIMDNADVYAQRVDSVLLTANIAMNEAARTFRSANVMIEGSSGDLRLTMASMRATAQTLSQLIHSEQARVSSLITNLDSTTGNINRITTDNRDSLAMAVRNLNGALRRADANLSALEHNFARVDSLLAQAEHGNGNVGRLLRDSTLYMQVDSLANNLNRIMSDFQKNPGRYLRHVDIIDVF